MAIQIWETIKESITTYTGLSPAIFFTFLVLGLTIYYIVSNLFGSSDASQYQRSRDVGESVQPLPPPVNVGEITAEDLKNYDGSDPQKPLLMAIKGQIYDVSHSRMFYGPGGPYALFAGKDASRALAKMSFEEKDLTGDITGLGMFELEALQDWEYKFMSKYVKVGTVKTPEPTAESGSNPAEDSSSVSNTAEVAEANPREITDHADDSKLPVASEDSSELPETDHSTKLPASSDNGFVKVEVSENGDATKAREVVEIDDPKVHENGIDKPLEASEIAGSKPREGGESDGVKEGESLDDHKEK